MPLICNRRKYHERDGNLAAERTIPNLLKRAAVMAEIRRFFTDRGVLEVETPCMSQATVTDIHLFPFETRFVGPGHSQGLNLYLMTSPEYHMKRLLAAGCGPVFQLCRSFRNEEMGRHHNPEFTMLEWYRATGMRPYLDKLNKAQQEEFERDVSAQLVQAYPAQRSGEIIFRFPRLFFTAVRPGA